MSALYKPVSDIMKYVIRYDLEETVRECARQEAPNWKLVRMYKQTVRRSILKHDELRWQASTALYGSLSVYRLGSVKWKRIHMWWKYVARQSDRQSSSRVNAV